MASPDQLLHRLSEIAASLEQSGKAQALIGLGSTGPEQWRLDNYSDLDFFVVADLGQKAALLADLSWLTCIAPLAFLFRNTADGYKCLYEDGIFCEFAVFEAHELPGIPFAPGSMVWKKKDVPDILARPTQRRSVPPVDLEGETGEALTNLFVGLQRYARGERLSAFRFVQGYALDRVFRLALHLEASTKGMEDVFAVERRFEQRFPEVATQLPAFAPGYVRTPQAALAILEWLEARVPVNAAMAAAIRHLYGKSVQDDHTRAGAHQAL
ncbi:hypothetical protein DEDE109153_07295 [Deinococcus deserti]|uniref:Uncharacterized protein n=1 Tax=Deinococcus deserti (strain DSM 17065 / CIP 109153 / LMG 22923 / VCD115) TaxID=546414 RepID=C1CWL2_DEIDV|nr:hypothetical protein [Deinococcus deserti]ACO46579.1 hypothetical protein Deide_16120 [Deinococcus deserti VCD115]